MPVCAPGNGPCLSAGAADGRILIAVGKTVVSLGLIALIERGGRGGDVLVAEDEADARALLGTGRIDLVLIAADWFDHVGAALLRRCSRRVLLVSDQDHGAVGEAGWDGLACGLLSESLPPDAIRTLLAAVQGCQDAPMVPSRCARCVARQTWRPGQTPLSPRELDVFRAIGLGAGPQQIGRDLGMSVKTVESHREKIKRKLGLNSADALAYAAMRWCRGYRVNVL